jgi:hypothetical protein
MKKIKLFNCEGWLNIEKEINSFLEGTGRYDGQGQHELHDIKIIPTNTNRMVLVIYS